MAKENKTLKELKKQRSKLIDEQNDAFSSYYDAVRAGDVDASEEALLKFEKLTDAEKRLIENSDNMDFIRSTYRVEDRNANDPDLYLIPRKSSREVRKVAGKKIYEYWQTASKEQQVARKAWNEKGKNEAQKKLNTAREQFNYFNNQIKKYNKLTTPYVKMGIYNSKTGRYDKFKTVTKSEYLKHCQDEARRWLGEMNVQKRHIRDYQWGINDATTKIKIYEDNEKAHKRRKQQERRNSAVQSNAATVSNDSQSAVAANASSANANRQSGEQNSSNTIADNSNQTPTNNADNAGVQGQSQEQHQQQRQERPQQEQPQSESRPIDRVAASLNSLAKVQNQGEAIVITTAAGKTYTITQAELEKSMSEKRAKGTMEKLQKAIAVTPQPAGLATAVATYVPELKKQERGTATVNRNLVDSTIKAVGGSSKVTSISIDGKKIKAKDIQESYGCTKKEAKRILKAYGRAIEDGANLDNVLRDISQGKKLSNDNNRNNAYFAMYRANRGYSND